MGKQIVRQPRITRMEKGATSIRITWSEINLIEFSQNVSTESPDFSGKNIIKNIILRDQDITTLPPRHQ